jgi:hypothetical protein
MTGKYDIKRDYRYVPIVLQAEMQSYRHYKKWQFLSNVHSE